MTGYDTNHSGHLAVARDVLSPRVVRQLLAIFAFFLAVAAVGSPALAGEPDEIETRAAQIGRLESERARLSTEKQKLARLHEERAAEIQELKAQRPSWNRDRRLEKLLREDQELATALGRKQHEIRTLDDRIAAERRALVEAIDRALAGGEVAEPRRGRLQRLRADALAKLPRVTKKLRLPDDRIDPLDDPEDLEAKAAELRRSEDEIRAEELRLERRAQRYRLQAKLTRSRQRSEEHDVFREDGPRRRTTGHVKVAGDAENQGPTAGVPGSGADGAGGAAPPASDGGFGTPTEEGDSSVAEPATDRGVDLTVVYGDIVEPGTLVELRRAERSGDPEAKARAVERARADLRARAERLRQKRLEMERRARELRQVGPRTVPQTHP